MIATEKDSMVYYYILNEHGDVTQLWSQSGTCKASYEYDAFGVERNLDKEDENPFRYCGEYFDLSSGTYYLRARDYRPGTGRFTSEDSVERVARKLPNGQEVTDPLSFNKYTYCYNNPVRFTDPSGNVPFMLLAGAAGALAGAVTAGIKSALAGKFSWKDVGEGALIGGAIGLTGGSAVSLLATGSAFATTGAVMTGLGFGAGTVGTAGATGFEQARQLVERSGSVVGEQIANSRNPIFADNNLLVNAFERGSTTALSEIRAGQTFLTQAQYNEFLHVNTSAQVQARLNFLNTENITVYTDPDIINSQVYLDVYNTIVKAGHGVGDAMLAGYAKATGIEAVTMERRLFNFLTETLAKLAVPIRRIH